MFWKKEKHVYTLTETMANKLLRRGYELHCFRCNKELIIGQKIKSINNTSHKMKTKLYHIKCWNSMFH
jgi:hypothetical protein